MPDSDVKALSPKTVRDISTVDKINEWDQRNQRSIESTDRLSQNLQDFNLNEVPLSKRYEFQCSQLNTSQPSTSKAKSSGTDDLGNVSMSTNESFDDSFHSASHSFSHPEQPKIEPSRTRFKIALEQEKGCFTPRMKERVLMHCKEGVFVRSVSSIEEVNFVDEMYAKLKSKGLNQVFRVQAVAWPHLLRGHSLIIINGAKTGKTWTYLPAVCSLLMEAHNDEKIVECDGPVMIILCLDSLRVDRVYKNCRELLGKDYSCEAYSQHENEEMQNKMLNGLDILVTTVPCLLRLMRNPLRFFNKHRMTTIVFDEIDSMCDRFGESDVETIYRTFCVDTKIQTIVTSKTWHKIVKKCAQKDDVLLCIGAYIEAAIYSNVEITVQSTNQKDRYRHFLSHFEKRNNIHEATVIVCSEMEEVIEIARILENGCYSITSCHDKTDSSTINEINKQMRDSPDPLDVLVCTDDVLGDLNIRHAQHIIHFSLPKNWTTFTQRFIASFDFYEKSVQNSSGRPTTVIFVDEGSCDTMPRLIDFMRFRCFADVPESILEMADKNRIKRETQLTRYKPFCNNLLLLGACPYQYTCDGRHILTESDRPHEIIPRSGEVKMHILATHTPAHFTVRLLEHRKLGRIEWQKMPHADEAFGFQKNFNEYFQNPENHEIHYPPKLNDLCVIDSDSDTFDRCKIIGIDINEINKQTTINLLLIDKNETMECYKSNDLLVMPPRFKEFPPQAVDIRIADIVPLDLDTTWESFIKHEVKNWINEKPSCQIRAEIELTVMNTIWVKSVKIVEKLPSIKEEVIKTDIKKKLIDEGYGVAKDSLKTLQAMAMKSGLLNDVQRCYTPIKVDQKRGSGRGKVLSQSSNESVHSQLNSSHGSHSSSFNDSSFNSSDIARTKSPKSPELISSPDRACIRTRWAKLVPDKFNEVDIGEFYSPDRFYVLLANQYLRFKKLREKIAKFANEPKNLQPLAKVEVGGVCLLAAFENPNDYRRGKIMEVDEDEATGDIFLVDYGVEEYRVPLSSLIEIPEKFISDLPFQAIHCRMIGIRPTDASSVWSEDACSGIYNILNNSKELFVRAFGKHSITSDNIKCNSYEVVYVDKTHQSKINELIVQKKLADFHPETEHFINLSVDWNSLLTVSSEEEEEDWDSEPNNGQIFDAGVYLNRTNHDDDADADSDMEFDVQFDEDQIREWIGLPKDSKLSAPDNRLVCPSESSPQTKKDEDVSAAKVETSAERRSTEPNDGTESQVRDAAFITNQLVHPAKMSQIIWKQTAEMVVITIAAPDVKDYYLRVASRSVHFSFLKNSDRFENILNLFGCVDIKFTSHEIRGLNLVVRLKKTLAGVRWPRLVQSTDKNQFIKCDIDEREGSDDKTAVNHIVRDTKNASSSSDEDDDDGEMINDVELL